jgi:hypothetical protein
LQTFLENISKNHQIPLADLKRAFEDTKAIPSIKKLVMPPPPGVQKNWKVYRSRFVEPRRLAAGQKFWITHRSFIEKTEKETAIEVQAPPPALQYIVSDITPEKLIEANMNTPKGILMLRDEFRGYLKDIGRYNKSGEVEQLLSSFSQTPMTVNRSTKVTRLIACP